ncbi:MAG: hypothetical protein Fur0010_19790 [Bdellovibrio sp.]
MKNKLILTFSVLLFVSCETLQDTYQQQWRPQLGEKEREMVESFNQEPQFFPQNKTLTSAEVQSYINEALEPPSETYCQRCVEEEVQKTGYNARSPLLDDPNARDVLSELGAQPEPGGGVRTPIPNPGSDPVRVAQAGYYLYGESDGKIYGTRRTIWNLRAAGRVLARSGISMAIGDISSNGGRTSGHAEHQGGNDVDIRLVGRDGKSRACTINDSSCYDRGKTFEMIKALIDVDPSRVDKILINDRALQTMVNRYAREQYPQIIRRDIARSCSGHDNHLHFSWTGG